MEQDHWQRTVDIREERKDEKPRFRTFGGIRHWIESVFDTRPGQLDIQGLCSRTIAGVYAKVRPKLLDLSATVWHIWRVWRVGAPRKGSLIACEHSESHIYFLGSSVRVNFPARSDVSRSCSWPSTFVK